MTVDKSILDDKEAVKILEKKNSDSTSRSYIHHNVSYMTIRFPIVGFKGMQILYNEGPEYIGFKECFYYNNGEYEFNLMFNLVNSAINVLASGGSVALIIDDSNNELNMIFINSIS